MFRATHRLSSGGENVVRWRRLPDNVQHLHVQQPSTYAKPEAACAIFVVIQKPPTSNAILNPILNPTTLNQSLKLLLILTL
jgi:hypothetical protein